MAAFRFLSLALAIYMVTNLASADPFKNDTETTEPFPLRRANSIWLPSKSCKFGMNELACDLNLDDGIGSLMETCRFEEDKIVCTSSKKRGSVEITILWGLIKIKVTRD